MGGCSSCMRKPILVYQGILEECYSLLSQANTQNTKPVQKKRIHKSSMDYGQNQENQEFISLFEEINQSSIKAQATESYKQFMSQDVPKLESQVRLQAKTLSDHIQDTHIRLIDTVKYLKVQLRNYQTDYGGQWVTLIILEVLVQNLKNYTQKHISLKQAQAEDSNMVSKLDNLTENNDVNNTKEDKHNVPYGSGNQNNPADQITFFSDNFIRFEIDFIDIALFILNDRYNPFYAQTQNQFMNILLKFSQLHKDPYTSDKIYGLVDQLETDLYNLTREIVPAASSEKEELLPTWESINKNKVDTLSILQVTYQATLSKLKAQQNVFRSKHQLNFFFFTLQTIMDYNRILRNYSSKLKADIVNNPLASPAIGVGGIDQLSLLKNSSEKTIHQIVAEITSNCLGILSVFARRGFILKQQNIILTNLFQFFDEVKWDSSLLIENIINETISVSRLESIDMNYKTVLMEQLIEYLSLSKSLAGIPSLFFNSNFQQVNNMNNNPNRPQSLNEISIGIGMDNVIPPAQPPSQKKSIKQPQQQSAQKEQKEQKEEVQLGLIKLENFADPKVKIRALRLMNMLISQKGKDSHLLTHSTNKIIKCYLENLKEFNDVADVKKAFQQSFVHYTLQLAPDSSTLLTLLTDLSNDISEFLSNSNISKNQLMNTPKQSPHNGSAPPQVNKSPSEISNSNNLLGYYQGNDQTKYVIEGLNLMLLALECSIYFTSPPLITDVLIMNLIYICNIKQVSLLAYEVTCKLILLKMKPLTESNSNGNLQALSTLKNGAENYSNSINNNILISNHNYSSQITQMSSQISSNSLLHIYHQTIKCVFNLNMQQDVNSVYNAIVIYQYTSLIIQEVTKRNNVYQMGAIFAYLMKLIKETSIYQSQKDNIQVNSQYHGIINSSPDPSQFNSTNNQFALQAMQKNGQQNMNGSQVQYHSIQKHPACFNITQLAIGHILQILEQHLISNANSSQHLQLQEIINNLQSKEISHLTKMYNDIFSLHNDIAHFNKQQNYTVEQHSKNLPAQKSIPLKGNSPGSFNFPQKEENVVNINELKQKILKFCNQIYETPYVSNELFNNSKILENISKVAKSSGFNPEQDFDQMTAQFARNFTSAVGDIDFNNYNFDDDMSLNATGSKNPRNSHNNNYLRLNTNESLGALEREDEQFGYVLNMIQTKNPNLPNLLNEKNKDKFNSEKKQYESGKENILMGNNQHKPINQQNQYIDSVDIQIKV